MNILLIVSAVVAVAYGEAGYNYRQPSGYNYQQPIAQTLGGSSQFQGGSQGGSFSGSGSSSSGSSLGLNSGGNGGYNYQQPSVISNSASSGHSSQGYSYPAPQPPSIHKHVYVHVAPEEPEQFKQRTIQSNYRPQKHYKIIFVKAPSPPSYVAPQIQAQAQNEEKTLIYVLVKKPEEQEDIHIPSVAPTQPSKPEVYFIKYKTQKESRGGEYGAPGGPLGSPLGPSSIGSVGGSFGGSSSSSIGGSFGSDSSFTSGSAGGSGNGGSYDDTVIVNSKQAGGSFNSISSSSGSTGGGSGGLSIGSDDFNLSTAAGPTVSGPTVSGLSLSSSSSSGNGNFDSIQSSVAPSAAYGAPLK